MNAFRRLFFDFLYLRRPPWDSGVTPPEVNAWLAKNPPGRAIDLGCGTGTNVITLASHGWKVLGLDFSSRAIALARKKLKQAGLQAELRVEDVTRLDSISGPFNLALDLGCFHGLDQKGKAAYLQHLGRLLAPQSTWLLYTFLADLTPPGLSPADLAVIQSRFLIADCQEGFDKNGRASAYFFFQKL